MNVHCPSIPSPEYRPTSTLPCRISWYQSIAIELIYFLRDFGPVGPCDFISSIRFSLKVFFFFLVVVFCKCIWATYFGNSALSWHWSVVPWNWPRFSPLALKIVKEEGHLWKECIVEGILCWTMELSLGGMPGYVQNSNLTPPGRWPYAEFKEKKFRK